MVNARLLLAAAACLLVAADVPKALPAPGPPLLSPTLRTGQSDGTSAVRSSASASLRPVDWAAVSSGRK